MLESTELDPCSLLKKVDDTRGSRDNPTNCVGGIVGTPGRRLFGFFSSL